MAIWVNLTALCCWEGMGASLPFTSPLFALSHLSDAHVMPIIATLLWDSLSTWKEWTIWNCLPGGTRESGARRKGGKAIMQLGTGERTSENYQSYQGGSDPDETTILSTFSALTCSLLWPMKVSSEQFLHLFTQLHVNHDKVVLAAFWGRL